MMREKRAIFACTFRFIHWKAFYLVKDISTSLHPYGTNRKFKVNYSISCRNSENPFGKITANGRQ
jgi:hypothetical protein